MTIGSVIVASNMINLASDAAEKKKAAESSFAKAREAERFARAAEEEGRKLLYTTDMQLAPFIWRDDRNTAEQLHLLLARHVPEGTDDDGGRTNERPDLRGFEWYYYQHLLEQSAAVFSEHGRTVVAGAFTANGQLVTIDENSQLRRWDLRSQQEDEASRRDLPFGSVASARALSPDGRLAALGERNKVHVFDLATGKETFSIDSADTPYRRPIFSQNAETLVIVDDKIRWFSAKSGEVIASFDQKFDQPQSLALSADGLTLAVVGNGENGDRFSIYRLDAAVKKVTPLANDAGSRGTLYASALSPDGRRIAVGAKLSAALLTFDTASGRSIARHPSAHASPIAAIAFAEGGAGWPLPIPKGRSRSGRTKTS